MEILPVHLPNRQNITFPENLTADELHTLANQHTKLTAWFHLNTHDHFAKRLQYTQIPEEYRWLTERKWRRRKNNSKCVTRLTTASPIEGERFDLRTLLLHPTCKGATSFSGFKNCQRYCL